MYREMALRTAHSVPMARHLGWKRMTNRLLQRFFWPGIYMDVQELYQICPECQRVGRHHKHKAPLMPLLVVDQPFEWVGIDLVGPLPRTKVGHHYVLTMVDYGTWYPEAIPLRQTDRQLQQSWWLFLAESEYRRKYSLTEEQTSQVSSSRNYTDCQVSNRSEPPPTILRPMVWWRGSTQQ